MGFPLGRKRSRREIGEYYIAKHQTDFWAWHDSMSDEESRHDEGETTMAEPELLLMHFR